MDQTRRHETLERLDALVGEWSLEVSLIPGAVGHATFAWALDRQFLLQRTAIEGPPESLAIVGLDRDGDGLIQHYFDARGVARLYAMTFDGREWTLRRATPDFTPLDFFQRFLGRLGPDGDTIQGRWETSSDGSTWERDFDLTYRRTGG